MSENIYETTLSEVVSSTVYKNTIQDSCLGVEIDGFLFIPDEISYDNSFSKREYKRTSIMSGGEFVSRSTYVPKEFSFRSILEVDVNEPYFYDNLFSIMENKAGGCSVISPFVGSIMGEINIDKIHNSPNTLEVTVKVKEIPFPNSSLYGDDTFDYPSINRLSDKVVTVDNGNSKNSDTSSINEWKKELVVNSNNPYNEEGYSNGF